MQNKFLRSELTKGSSFILAFSFLALFSFQDAVGAAFKVLTSSGDLFIIPHFRKFVKSFSKVSWSFFCLCGVHQLTCLFLSISSQAFLLYHIFRSLSRGFLKVFKIFLRSFLLLRSVVFLVLTSSLTPVRLGYRLCYYTTFLSFCQEVFEISFRLPVLLYGFSCSLPRLCDSRPAWQRTYLLYHISWALSRGFRKFPFAFFSRSLLQKLF